MSTLLFLAAVASLLLLSVSCSPVDAWNYTAKLTRDRRVAVVLGVFGHSAFGRTEVQVTNLVLEANMRAKLAAKVWVELRPVRTAANARKLKQLIEKEEADCSEIENTQLDEQQQQQLNAGGGSATATAAPATAAPPILIAPDGALAGGAAGKPRVMKQYLKFVTSQIREEDEDVRSSVTFITQEPGLYAVVYARCISIAATSLASSSGAIPSRNRRKATTAAPADGGDDGGAGGIANGNPKSASDAGDEEQRKQMLKRKRKLRVTTTGHFRVSQWNPVYLAGSSSGGGGGGGGGELALGATYLSVGETPLPTIFGLFALLFAVGTFLWYRDLQRALDSKGAQRVSAIHYAMLLLGVLKAATLLLQAGVYAHRNRTGGTGDAVDIIFVAVATAKTAILFVIVILLAYGWSLSRASLSERERQLLLTVLFVQLVVNVALAVIEEGAPVGSEKAQTWKQWLRILDLGSALVVLVPIVYRAKTQHDAAVQQEQQRHQQELDEREELGEEQGASPPSASRTSLMIPVAGDHAYSADGGGGTGAGGKKEAQRLAVFRTFYITTVVFLYFTRIVVPYLESHVPYLLAWVPHLVYEVSAFVFYWIAAHLFAPSAEAWSVGGGKKHGAADENSSAARTSVGSRRAATSEAASAANAKGAAGAAVSPDQLEELELN